MFERGCDRAADKVDKTIEAKQGLYYGRSIACIVCRDRRCVINGLPRSTSCEQVREGADAHVASTSIECNETEKVSWSAMNPRGAGSRRPHQDSGLRAVVATMAKDWYGE